MKTILWIAGLALITLNCFSATQNSENYAVCRQPYALCTTAPCTPIPGSKNQSICSCVVKDGASLGQLPCEQRKPTINSNGQQMLTSTYSFENSATNKVMTCTGNHPWANCLDKPCIIDPQNSNQAICTCEIKHTESFLTFGGQCATTSCSTTLYSGATAQMNEGGSKALMNALHLSKSPMQNCPIS
jgi:hypothetical protein